MLSLFKRKATDVNTLFQQGLELYQNGDDAGARERFKGVLAQDAMHVGAHHLTGYALLRENNPRAALPHLRIAFAADRTDAELAVSLSKVLLELGELHEALACYEAVPTEVRSPQLLRDYGSLLADFGRYAESDQALNAALTMQPDDPATWTIIGNVYRVRGNLAEAKRALLAALRCNSDWVQAMTQLAFLLQVDGNLEGAAEMLERAQQSQPQNGEVAGQLADALRLLGRRDEAETQLKNALKLHEDEIKTNADNPALWNSYGLLLKTGGNIKSAIYAFNCALDLDPNHRQAINNIATLFSDIRDLDAAEAAFERALAIKPIRPEIYTNLGAIKFWRGQTKEALALYEQATAHGVNNGELAFNRSLAVLLTGDYKLGFQLYERRFETVPFRGRGGSHFKAPRWNGEVLTGKRLLIWHEQGLGDMLQCARYIPLLQERGANVILYVQPALLQLLKASLECDVVAGDSAPPKADYHCPLFSLPHAFGTTADTIPWRGPYVVPKSEWIEAWRARLGGGAHPKIGIVWAGNPNHINDSNRSMKFDEWSTLLSDQSVQWHSLQKGPAELREPRTDITNIAAGFGDFSDTAAAIANLDLVIAVDTSVAHLAAAMGRPTWLLIPFAPDWRWFEQRSDSPWYPSMRIFRQKTVGNWNSVIDEVKSAVQNRAFLTTAERKA